MLKLTFSELITEEEQSVYKCLKAVPPKAKNGVFKESIYSKDQFSFIKPEKDKERPLDEETGYVSPAEGDSGGGYWTYRLKDGELRHILVAIASWVGREEGEAYASYTNNAKYQCRIGATKITDDILRWITDLDGITAN